jgi:hypothetical protein
MALSPYVLAIMFEVVPNLNKVDALLLPYLERGTTSKVPSI